MAVTAKRAVEMLPVSEDAIIRHGRGLTTVFRVWSEFWAMGQQIL